MNPALARLAERSRALDSLLCVGLDPAYERLPATHASAPLPQASFAREIADATAPYAAAFKLNSAFYEARGTEGWTALQATMDGLREHHPDAFVILDAKRGDVASTSAAYARAAFDVLGADAVTLNPYLGRDALEPFLERDDRACVVLARTSNPGAGELQDLEVDGVPLWRIVAERAATTWNAHGNVMLVAGATSPDRLAELRAALPTVPLLVPGVGAQGGDAAATVRAGSTSEGGGLLVNASRSVLFAPDPAAAAAQLRDRLRAASGGAPRAP